MKKSFILITAFILMMLISACGSQQMEELEQLRTEIAVYEQYADIIDALEADDYSRAAAILDGYREQKYNQQLAEELIQEITINDENWSNYFEVKKITEWLTDDMGETTGFITHVFVVLSDKLADQILLDRSKVSFAWSALCSVKNCDVDLENKTIAYENVFKSNSTTFGDSEVLSGTVSFSPESYNSDYWSEYSAVAEIGEIVIVGEYLLGTEMKPICFDYDDISVEDAEGVLTLYNSGE